jgi:hypothetical protein
MKKRDARALAEIIHDKYMNAAISGQGFDEAYDFTRKQLRKLSQQASGAAFWKGKAAVAAVLVEARVEGADDHPEDWCWCARGVVDQPHEPYCLRAKELVK